MPKPVNNFAVPNPRQSLQNRVGPLAGFDSPYCATGRIPQQTQDLPYTPRRPLHVLPDISSPAPMDISSPLSSTHVDLRDRRNEYAGLIHQYSNNPVQAFQPEPPHSQPTTSMHQYADHLVSGAYQPEPRGPSPIVIPAPVLSSASSLPVIESSQSSSSLPSSSIPSSSLPPSTSNSTGAPAVSPELDNVLASVQQATGLYGLSPIDLEHLVGDIIREDGFVPLVRQSPRV